MHVLLSTFESLQKLPRKILAAEELSDNNASDRLIAFKVHLSRQGPFLALMMILSLRHVSIKYSFFPCCFIFPHHQIEMGRILLPP
jgi:hypothetical protein